tara:strand:+ start:120 stop:2732 length:2613 start_codon:yes stop_codon:yes gene_type:complete
MKTTLISFLLIAFISITIQGQTFKIDHYEPEGNGFVFDNIIINVYDKPASNGETRVYAQGDVWEVSYKYNGKIYKSNDAPINGKIDNLFAVRITQFDILFTNGLKEKFAIYPNGEDTYNIYCCEDKYIPQSIQISSDIGSGIDARIEGIIKNRSNSSDNTPNSSNSQNNSSDSSSYSNGGNNYSTSTPPSESTYQQKQREDAEANARQDRARQDAQRRADAQVASNQRKAEQMNAASDKLEREWTDQINSHFESTRKFNNYRDQVRSATSLSNSSDPYQLIRQFEQKERELKRVFDERLIDRKREIEQAAQKLRQEGNQFADLAGTLGKLSVQNQVTQAKKEATEDLERELRGYLRAIQQKLLDESKRNKMYYVKYAISAIDEKSEEFYLNMARYYDCKIDEAENGFSIHSLSWVDPDCDKPSEPYQLDPPSTNKQLYEAYKRKKRSNNKELRNEAPEMLDMALKMDPTNIEYLYEKSKSFDLGTDKNLMYLAKCKNLQPEKSVYSDEYYYSIALKQKKSTFFKYYLDNYSNGKYTKTAREKLDDYLKREIREVSYHEQVNKLNTELKNRKFEMAQETFQKIDKTEFYSDEDIKEITLLKEYMLYQKGKRERSSDALLVYLTEPKYGNWKSEVLNLLEEILIENGDSSLSNKEHNSAILYYSKFLEYFPSSQKSSYANKQIKKARQKIKNETSYLAIHLVFNDNSTMGFGNIGFKSKGFGFYWLPIANFSKVFADDEVEINNEGHLAWTNELFDDSPLLINRTENVKSYMAYGISIGLTHKLYGPFWLSGGIGYGKYIQRDEITYDENRSYSNERFIEESVDKSISGGTLYFEYGVYLKATKNILVKMGFLSSSKMNSVQFGLSFSIHDY